MKKILDNLGSLFQFWASEDHQTIKAVAAHGSTRQYFRVTGASKQAIGVYNPDKAENLAFLSFSRRFLKSGLNVPRIYAEAIEKDIYLIQDLGDTTLFDILKQTGSFSDEAKKYYERVVDILPHFQIKTIADLDFSVCFPRAAFDRQSMQWDLNYFKYYFLKAGGVYFHEQELEDDFQTLMDFLLTARQDYFLYRDFQSRNIMIRDDQPYFIDYQGGRKGTLHYDLASLLFDAKADIPVDERKELLYRYISRVSGLISIDRDLFIRHYYGYVLIRVLQALGAYGYRGFYERKAHFLQSIPFAQKNIKWLLENEVFPLKLPALTKILVKIIEKQFVDIHDSKDERLTVRVTSFSYKKGLPQDDSGNGGGFIFDCRFLPNPGRYEEYKRLTGLDTPVIEFLEKEAAVSQFREQTREIVSSAVDNYMERKFTNLTVNFGCTGGQHRSVYLANQLAVFLKKKYNINVILKHREQD